jgi:hypothetical protein
MAKVRDPIKWVRDRAKSRYEKGSECYICGATEKLDFHHYHTMTPLFNRWCKEMGYNLTTDDEVVEVRDSFIADHYYEVFKETVTLCHPHHMKLHSVYGKDPPLITAEKQKRWVGIQREKHELARQNIQT